MSRAVVGAGMSVAMMVGCVGGTDDGPGRGSSSEKTTATLTATSTATETATGTDAGRRKQSLSVLLIGNSQLGAYSDPPQPPDVVAALSLASQQAWSGATELVVSKVQRAGTGCAGFADEGDGEGTPLGEAGSGRYDVVVLLPSIDETDRSVAEPCWERFRKAAEGSDARFGVMATAHLSDQYPKGFADLDAAVRSYAAENALLFVPAGAVWRRLLGESPSERDLLSFYGGDLEHPGPEGSYLYVLSLYGAISGRKLVESTIENDLPSLRCRADESCFSEEEMQACLDEAGEWQCEAGNGAVFSNGHVQFVTDEEARRYAAAVDAELAAR